MSFLVSVHKTPRTFVCISPLSFPLFVAPSTTSIRRIIQDLPRAAAVCLSHPRAAPDGACAVASGDDTRARAAPRSAHPPGRRRSAAKEICLSSAGRAVTPAFWPGPQQTLVPVLLLTQAATNPSHGGTALRENAPRWLILLFLRLVPPALKEVPSLPTRNTDAP